MPWGAALQRRITPLTEEDLVEWADERYAEPVDGGNSDQSFVVNLFRNKTADFIEKRTGSWRAWRLKKDLAIYRHSVQELTQQVYQYAINRSYA